MMTIKIVPTDATGIWASMLALVGFDRRLGSSGKGNYEFTLTGYVKATRPGLDDGRLRPFSLPGLGRGSAQRPGL